MPLRENRIAELLDPFLEGLSLSKVQLEALVTYLDLLLKWNSKINLTAVRNPEEIVTRHFGESLFAARQLFPEPKLGSVVDVGSGAGFPGIPIKVWNESVDLVLIESNQKKAVFLREVVRALGLKEVSVEATRAKATSAVADLVTLRAVESFEHVLESARRLLRPGGRLALLIGEAQVQTAKTVLADVNWQDPIRIPLSGTRTLLMSDA